MIVNFNKMHCLGNDFIIIDAITQNIKFNAAYIKKIADRKVGIGCDQVIILEPPISPLVDFYYKIYNSDGKSAEQCLNGIRCAARFAVDNGLVKNSNILAECVAGKVNLIVESNQSVIANLSVIKPKINDCLFNILGIDLQTYHLSIGNPHLICFVNDSYNLKKELPELDENFYQSGAVLLNNQQQLHTRGVNIGFAKVINNNKIQLRVFERGAGETLACGSNALAAFIVANSLNLLNSSANIEFKLGSLKIENVAEDFRIQGPVISVFSGKFKI